MKNIKIIGKIGLLVHFCCTFRREVFHRSCRPPLQVSEASFWMAVRILNLFKENLWSPPSLWSFVHLYQFTLTLLVYLCLSVSFCIYPWIYLSLLIEVPRYSLSGLPTKLLRMEFFVKYLGIVSAQLNERIHWLCTPGLWVLEASRWVSEDVVILKLCAKWLCVAELKGEFSASLMHFISLQNVNEYQVCKTKVKTAHWALDTR